MWLCRAQGLGDSSDELRQEIDSLRADVALLQSELAARFALLFLFCPLVLPHQESTDWGGFSSPADAQCKASTWRLLRHRNSTPP